MATRIRLKRMGRKGRPFYRVVVADSRMPRDGRFIDHLGHYDPLPHPAKVVINEDRALHWLKTGATPTPTVRNLLHKTGILLRWDMERRGLGAPEQKEAMQKFEVMQLERDRRRALKRRKKKPAAAAPAPAPAAESAPAEG